MIYENELFFNSKEHYRNVSRCLMLRNLEGAFILERE